MANTVEMKNTILEILKAKNGMLTAADARKAVLDKDFVLSAVKQYMAESGTNLAKLLDYAEQLKVRNTVRQYMEVLV